LGFGDIGIFLSEFVAFGAEIFECRLGFDCGLQFFYGGKFRFKKMVCIGVSFLVVNLISGVLANLANPLSLAPIHSILGIFFIVGMIVGTMGSFLRTVSPFFSTISIVISPGS
jgi:hypothetical protein